MEFRDLSYSYPKYDKNYEYKQIDVEADFTMFEIAIQREIYQLMDALDEISTALKKGDVDFAKGEVFAMEQYLQGLVNHLRHRYDVEDDEN